MESETPRTDAAAIQVHIDRPEMRAGQFDCVTLDFARELERNLSCARAELLRLREIVGDVDAANIDLVLNATQ